MIRKEGAEFTFDTPTQMPFLDGVMKEVCTYHPSLCYVLSLFLKTIRSCGILVVFRAVQRDFPLAAPAGMVVPKGHFLVMTPQIIHQDPEVYANPTKVRI